MTIEKENRNAVNLTGPHFCYYCGTATEMPAYIKGEFFCPACCARDVCIDRWKPLLRGIRPEAIVEGSEGAEAMNASAGGKEVNFFAFKYLPTDLLHGDPRHQLGNRAGVGSWWTIPFDCSVEELVKVLHPRVVSKQRLRDIREARDGGIELDPIEVGVYLGGGGWLIDGNHRLVEARRRGDEMIKTRFTFQEKM